MTTAQNKLFRNAALERLSSPSQLDERLTLVSYRPWVRIALPVLVVLVVTYAVWIASAL